MVENSVESLAVQVDAFALEYLEVWDRTMSVNLRGLFITNQAFGRRMLDRRSGVIVNISSMSGNLVVNTPQKQCAYNASKAAVTALTTSPPLRSRRPPTVTPPPKRRVSRSRNGDTLIRPCAPAEADEIRTEPAELRRR